MTVKIEDLKSNQSFNSDLMLDENFLLLPASAEVSEDLIKALKTWDFKEFTSKDEEKKPEIAPQPSKTPQTSIPPSSVSSTPAPKISKEELNAASDDAKMFEQPNTETIDSNELSRIEVVQKNYQEYMKFINSIYTQFATHRTLSIEGLTDMVKNLCVFIKDNKRYVLRISPSSEARSKNFLVIHSMRSTVIALTIGLELHLEFSKLIELGVASILHEIGMLRLPPQLYMTTRMLSPAEKTQISMHPLYSCNILKEQNFPLSIQLGVLDHHEKETGDGYPRHLSGDKISPYAKIISVACSFEAITAPRTYKTERTTYDAMVEMLHNPNRQYDGNIIKALLYSISLYPIGAYVYLDNGKVGVVLDVNPDNPKNPIVQMLYEKEADGSPKTVQTDEDKNKIERVLTKEEQAEVVAKIDAQIEAEKQKKLEREQAIAKERAARAEKLAENAKAKAAENQKKKEEYSSVDLSDFI